MRLFDFFKRKDERPELDRLLDQSMQLGIEADKLRERRQAIKARIAEILEQRNSATVQGAQLEAGANNG